VQLLERLGVTVDTRVVVAVVTIKEVELVVATAVLACLLVALVQFLVLAVRVEAVVVF
jgi:hypothetical protein